MGAALRMTEADDLAFDLATEGRHEFVNGEVIAISGGSEAHALATMNVGAVLRGALRGGPCRAPRTTPPTLLNPKVLVEVRTRNADGSWTLREAAGEGEVAIAPLGVVSPLSEVYADFDALVSPR